MVHNLKPPRLIPGINRCGHFLLTKAIKKITSQNELIEVGTPKMPASVNID